MRRRFWLVLAGAIVLHISGQLRGIGLPVIAGLFMLDRCAVLLELPGTLASILPSSLHSHGQNGLECPGGGQLHEDGLEGAGCG